jgi:CheY-like chemotaxis protein
VPGAVLALECAGPRSREPRKQVPRRPPPLRAVPPAGAPLPRLDGITVLVVDDDPDARDVARQMLEPLGARVVVAPNGPEALALWRRAAAHIVLLDLLMPGMDGFRVIRALRDHPRGARLPVVAMTALGTETDYYRTWEAGFDGHLTKPVEHGDLASVIQVLTRRRAGPSGGWWGVGSAAGPRRPRRRR